MVVGARRGARVAREQRKMVTRLLGVVALCALGCGGKAVDNDAGGATAGAGAGGTHSASPDGAIPTRGFYRKSIMTVADSCKWSGTAAGDIGLVGASQTDVAAQLGSHEFARTSAVSGFKLTLPGCEAFVSAQVLSRDATSFVLDVKESWQFRTSAS